MYVGVCISIFMCLYMYAAIHTCTLKATVNFMTSLCCKQQRKKLTAPTCNIPFVF